MNAAICDVVEVEIYSSVFQHSFVNLVVASTNEQLGSAGYKS